MKNYIWIAFFFLLLSCKDTEVGHDVLYYKITSDYYKNVRYMIRDYSTNSDTLTEREIQLGSEDKLSYDTKFFLKKNNDVFIIRKFKDSMKVYPYLSTSKIDSCNRVFDARRDYIIICNGGKADYLNNKEAYKIEYRSDGIDGENAIIYRDREFRVIAIIYEFATVDKETRVKESDVPKRIRDKLKNEMASYSQSNLTE